MSEVNRVSNVNQNNVNNVKTSKSSSTSAFSSYLGESKNLDAIFDEAAQKYNVPVNLLKAIGKQESNFNEKAVSRCGAQGIMQLMPATAASLGVKDAYDAEQNIMGGAKYISGLLKKYDGNTKLALAAYNAGSGNVAKYGGIPPFKETQNYVKKVMGYLGQDINAGTINNTATGSTETTNKVTTPVYYNGTGILPQDNDTTEELSSSFDNVFTYDDYLNFLDKFLDNDDKKNADKEDQANYFSSQNINFNVPVMNLINSIN